MPFKYKAKEGHVRKGYSPERMRSAVRNVVEEGSSVRGAALRFEIDRKTLDRYVKKYRESDDKGNLSFTPNYKTGQIFSDDLESLLENYLITSSKLHYGLTPKTARTFVYQFAISNNIKIPQSWHDNKAAGYDWLRGFMSRHRNLSLRLPESTSLGRSTAFNKNNVDQFFANLKQVLTNHQYGPESIYNVDETGLTTVHKPGRIISIKGEKQVAKVTSGERGTLVTVCCAISAIGSFIPPFFIFPRHRVTDAMSKGAPPGSHVVAHPSGWMTRENFEVFLKHFIKFSKASREHRVLLVLDNHDSHITPNGINLCRQNGITLLTLPPHTSHKLQPLDRTVFGPFKAYYNQVADDFMVNHPGQPMKIQDIPELVGKAFPKAFTPTNIQKGFSSTGIYPFNSSVFSDEDFLGAFVTDRPLTAKIDENLLSNSKMNSNIPSCSTFIGNTPSSSKIRVLSVQSLQNTQAPTPQENDSAEVSDPERNESRKSVMPETFLTPEQVRPFPKAGPRKTAKGGRKPRRSLILTTTPNKEEIEEEHRLRLERQRKKNEPKVKRVKKKLLVSSSSSSESEEEMLPTDDSDMDADIFDPEELDAPIEPGNFVLVKLVSKKTSYFYVARVLTKVSLSEYEVTYLKRLGTDYSFSYPEKEDRSTVSIEDITKLPPPLSRGGTERAMLKINFDFDFSAFKNVK